MGGPESVSKDVGSGQPVGDRDLRVSDAEREHVGELLQRAVGLGMLSLGEFTERMDTALAAKTRGELNSVLIDLPGVRLVGQPAAPATGFVNTSAPYQPPVAPPGTNHGAVIRSRLSGVNRRGPWHVPPTLHLNNWLSSVTLDFTEAVMATQVVEVVMDDFCSSLTLVVPAEATVDLNSLDLVGSSVNNKVRTGPPLGPLHLVVRGRVRFGSVTAKRPLIAHWRKLMGH
ncbi:protein of unknown function [Nocardia farcinica]|uniref:Domain of uncharacterized function (DUF1707) n=1 Tax=Nocardia farcinica TaxID=37329 RepID=A0A0H5P114_NOCFR|nr:Domain of uncharacterised function (DUF1707) [Nocardia farcinica]SIT12707.1 protein of unknown function [Nocardia farcinica]SUE31677.1 Domain of uncharacterised function (DUF1707) [Nocardia farcinica]VFA93214.1 Domain of uncharacterised function (DUF1707) [Nocardia farcinica]